MAEEIRAHRLATRAVVAIKTAALLDERLGLTAVGLVARSLALAGRPLVLGGLDDDPVVVAAAIEQLRDAGYLVGDGQILHLVDTPVVTATVTAPGPDPQARREQMHLVAPPRRPEPAIPEEVAQQGLANLRQALREARATRAASEPAVRPARLSELETAARKHLEQARSQLDDTPPGEAEIVDNGRSDA